MGCVYNTDCLTDREESEIVQIARKCNYRSQHMFIPVFQIHLRSYIYVHEFGRINDLSSEKT